jgi:hypothetical protein
MNIYTMHIICEGNKRFILVKFTSPIYNSTGYIKIRVFPDYVEIDIIWECEVGMLLNNNLNCRYFKHNEIWEHVSLSFMSLGICEKELLAAIEILRGFTF